MFCLGAYAYFDTTKMYGIECLCSSILIADLINKSERKNLRIRTKTFPFATTMNTKSNLYLH